MSEQHKIGLITVTYNSATVIDDFMKSLVLQTHKNWVLFVVDNNSTDATLELLANYADSRIKIIANQENVGVAAGNNQGIRRAIHEDCNLISLINNDIEFGPELFEVLLRNLQQLHCDVVAPKIYYYEPNNLIWFAGGGFRRIRYWLNEHYGMDSLDKDEYNEVKPILYAPTCCVMMRRDVFDKVGLMDERYFVYYDDSDFFIRANRSGIKIYYIPHAFLFHKVSTLTGKKLSKFRAFIESRNLVYFVGKNYSFFTLVLALVSQQLVALIKFLSFRDSYEIFKAKQKGFWNGIQNIKEFISQGAKKNV